VPGLVRADETPAERHPVAGRVFRPPPDARDTRDGEDRGHHLSPLLILAISGHEVRALGKSFGSRAALEGADLVVAHAVQAGPLQKESHMLSSDFLRGLRVRLVTAMCFLARHARHFENFTPNF